MLAFAGLFALVTALARPVDLWRVSVHSHRGQPLYASATIETYPGEHITQDCLSLGPESDAPGSDAPFLNAARLTANPAGTRLEIRTDFPIHSPTLALVLRVQCPGEMLYARHFSLLIPPAPAAAPAARTVPGFKLKVAEGETVESLARLLIPQDRKLRQKMVREVLASNPHAFPDGRGTSVAPGTLLFFPDLRILRDLPERAAPAAPSAGAGLGETIFRKTGAGQKGAGRTTRCATACCRADSCTGRDRTGTGLVPLRYRGTRARPVGGEAG
jgi:hypothetical protein